MTDYEPYVADPAESGPRGALQRSRPTIATAAAATILAAVAFLLLADRAEQDPSLEAPADAPADESLETPADAPTDGVPAVPQQPATEPGG